MESAKPKGKLDCVRFGKRAKRVSGGQRKGNNACEENHVDDTTASDWSSKKTWYEYNVASGTYPHETFVFSGKEILRRVNCFAKLYPNAVFRADLLGK